MPDSAPPSPVAATVPPASPGLPAATIRAALAAQPLFEDKTWRLSPAAWPLTAAQVEELRAIGGALLEFHRALEQLYLRSADNKNLLRNKKLLAPWVADYLDRGKPPALIAHARHKRLRGALPTVLRPDLLLTDDGWALTELDSVPGGIGLTAFLNRLYAAPGLPPVLGAEGDRMLDAWYQSLASLAPPHQRLPLIAIAVSDEAATYRPEMQWLAATLQLQGRRVYCIHPREIFPLGRTLCVNIGGNPEQIDVIYRFWELFDLANVAIAGHLLAAWDDAEVAVAPPMRPFQEEKLGLALFHHHLLEEYWKENLSRRALEWLKRLVPKSWIVEKADLPPTAVLDAPTVGGKPIWRWEQLADASQKERNLILKLSGFHEDAWGARSVVLGNDISREEWLAALVQAQADSPHHLHVLQEYRKPRRLSHPIYAPADGTGAPPAIYTMEGRLRLCPYYFVRDQQAELTGALATFCPADKKIIHGMKDAAMLPCAIVG